MTFENSLKNCTTIPLLLLALLLAACTEKSADDAATTAFNNGNASLYDQGATSACWVYAMLTCIEKEQQLTGDSIPLSRQWLIARTMEEQAMRRFLMVQRGETPPTAGADPRNAIMTRGVGPEVIRLINDYGLMPYSHEKTHITSDAVAGRRLTQLANTVASADLFRERMADLLPQFTVSMRGTFYLYSMQYTPQQFAESIMYRQHWHFYATEPQHPWGEDFALEVPDNYRFHKYTNLPMDSLEQRVIKSLQGGHPVYWEYGKKGRESSHSMAIIKLVRGKDGKPRLLCQNSYGRDWGRRGRCAVSLDFFRRHTCNVGLTEEQP